MKTVKIKIYNGLTLASPFAPLGEQPSGAIVFEVAGVPDDIPAAQILRQYTGDISVWRGIYSVSYHA